ncbi:hypothetical protein UFOVP233_77 [uncultured Caudovirales phage]|uniref:Uncharacterized protein n=1 Tax=uncultured Caudovirales phage TaxID=2100421 RepID=A0A6J7WZK6_9CAUD|nr:hypothetical protein UFOVP233_77 [uncultured Caudovirales phage]
MVSRYAIIEGGIVINIAMAGLEVATEQGWVLIPDDAAIGWTYDGSSFFAPPSPLSSVPASISFAQLLTGLVAEQWISDAEGRAWLKGTLPQALLDLIDTLPAESQFGAVARATAPSEVLRLDPLVELLGAAQGKSAQEVDTFFQSCANL